MVEVDAVPIPVPPAAPAPARSRLSWVLDDEASIAAADDDTLIVRHRQDAQVLRWVLKGLDTQTWQLLKDLGERRSIDTVVHHGDAPATATNPRLSQELNRLLSGRLVSLHLGDAAAAARPASRTARLALPLVLPRRPVRLSAYATVRRVCDALEIRSPIRGFVLECRDLSVGRLLERTAQLAHDPAQLIAELGGELDHDDAAALLAVLTATGVLGETGDDGVLAEEHDPVLVQRQAADVAFHHASRLGLHAGPTGATWRFAGSLPPAPALRPDTPPTGTLMTLERPGERTTGDELSFAEVVARRRSTREQGAEPLTARQLGEFLHRVARVDRIVPADGSTPKSYECSVRPYPSAGAAYELELYLVIDRCADIAKGLYRYRPLEHALQPLTASTAQCGMLLDHARMATGGRQTPQVMIIMAARFTRLSWKYENMAYAATLKNVGVLYESMYLTAAAMGLACCALGNSDSGVFAEATGLRVEEESSVGELALGSLPDRH